MFLFCYTDFQLDSGQVGWGIVAAVLSLKSIERSLGSVWNHRLAKTSILVPASSLLVDGSRFLIKDVSVYFSIHLSFKSMKHSSPIC